jgi:hypothetical protein
VMPATKPICMARSASFTSDESKKSAMVSLL